MSYAVVAAAVIGAAGTAYGAYSQKSAADKRAGALTGGTHMFDPQQVDLQSVLGNLLGANQQNLGAAENLTGAGNQFNFQQFMHYIKRVQPNFKPIQQQVGRNALSYSQGQLPNDVVNSIGRAASERGIQGGIGYGSQGAKTGALANLNLRNLGLTSLDLSKYGTNLGLQVNQSAKSLMPQLGNAFDWLFTPTQGLQASMFNTDWLNKAALANTAAQNTLTGNLADSQYASALGQASTVQQGANQLSSLLGAYGVNQSAKSAGTGSGRIAGSDRLSATGKLA